MPARFSRAAPPLLFFLLAVLLLFFWLAGRQHLLVVREAEGDRRLVVGFLAPRESFQIRFIHSVDLLPVYDEFRLLNGKLVLTGTRYLSFGAGLGYLGEGTLRGEGGWNVIEGMHRRADSLPLRVGTIADHTLLYRGREIHLKRYFRGQTLVRLEVERLLPGLLKGGVMYERPLIQ